MNPPRRLVRATIRIALLAAVGLTVFACGSKSEEARPTHERRPNGTVVLRGPSLSYVRVEPAEAATASLTRTLTARVDFDQRRLANIGPPVAGRVAAVSVVAGDHVAHGDILLMIHSADVAAAQAQVAETRTARILAEQTLTRTTSLVQQGAASPADQAQAEAAAAQARDEERRAEASIAAIGGGSGMNNYELRSPIDGTVVERNVSVGTEVHTDQDTPLMRVADLSTVWVIADVYEQDVPLVHVGDEADVEVLAYPGRTFTGRIMYAGDVVDSATRAIRARIELPNPDHALRPGMFARVQLRSAEHGIADVPTSAILARRDQYFVFVQNDDGSFSQREVRIGEQHGQHTTIVDGIHPGDRVVTEGAILLDAEANESL